MSQADMVTIVSNSDGISMRVPLHIVQQLPPFVQMMEGMAGEDGGISEDDGDEEKEPIQLTVYNQCGKCLHRAFQFVGYHEKVLYANVEGPITTSNFVALVSDQFDQVCKVCTNRTRVHALLCECLTGTTLLRGRTSSATWPQTTRWPR